MSNKVNVELPKDFGRGSRGLENEGTYHLAITGVDANPVRKFGDRKGERVDGFEITCQVLHGTAQVDGRCIEEGKQVNLTFNNPSLSSKDQGDLSRRKQGRFLNVTCLVCESDAGAKLSIDLDAALHRQFIAKFSEGLDKDKKKTGFIDLSYADMWHVDDPAVAAIPKDADWISTIPPGQRRLEKSSSAMPKDLPGQKKMFEEPVGKPAARAVKLDVSDL